MFEFPIRVPHLFILLGAAAWILFLFFRKPDFLCQRPGFFSLIEGFMLAVAWAVFLRLSMNDPLEGLLWSGVLTGSLWTSVVFYCRYRYLQSIHAEA